MPGTDFSDERIDAVLARYRDGFADEHVYLRPDTPAKKLQNAIGSYAPDVVPGEVLALVDNTVFGSGKDGALLTSTGLHAHEIATAPKHIGLAEIVEVGAQGAKVFVNHGQFLSVNAAERESARRFAELLRELAALAGGMKTAEPAPARTAQVAAAAQVAEVAGTPAPARRDMRREELTRPERVLAVLPGVVIEHGLHRFSNQLYTIVVSNHRLVFAKASFALARELSREAGRRMKAERGLRGQLSNARDELALTLLADRYRELSLDAALTESDDNFAIGTTELDQVEVAGVWTGSPLGDVLYGGSSRSATPNYLQLTLLTHEQKYVLQIDRRTETAAPGWRQSLAGLFGDSMSWNGITPEELAPPGRTPSP